MKKVYVILMVLFVAFTVYALGSGLHETVTSTHTFTFLNGDETLEIAVDTSYYELAYDVSRYRFGRVYYETTFPDTNEAAGLLACTIFVDVQTGTGGLEGFWETLSTYTITSDSNMTTSGWDLYSTTLADSAHSYLRIISRAQTDSTGTVALLATMVDSSYSATSTITVLMRE